MSLPTSAFNAAKSIFAGLSVVKIDPPASLFTAVTAATTVISKASHTIVDGDLVEYVSGTGFTGLVAGSVYIARDVVATVSFGLTATVGGAAITVGTSSAGVFQKTLVFESRLLDEDPSMEEKSLELPDATGKLRKVRTVTTKEQETYKFEMVETKRLLDIFGGALSGRIDAPATLYVPDPQDASGKCALKSEAKFPATLTRDGGMKFGDADFTKATLKIESNKKGAIAWTADATV